MLFVIARSSIAPIPKLLALDFMTSPQHTWHSCPLSMCPDARSAVVGKMPRRSGQSEADMAMEIWLDLLNFM